MVWKISFVLFKIYNTVTTTDNIVVNELVLFH